MFLRKFISLALLFVIAFSTTHEIAFASLESDSCSVKEYAQEFSKPVHKGDICDIHFEYHQPFLLPEVVSLYVQMPKKRSAILQESYMFVASKEFLKPPTV